MIANTSQRKGLISKQARQDKLHINKDSKLNNLAYKINKKVTILLLAPEKEADMTASVKLTAKYREIVMRFLQGLK